MLSVTILLLLLLGPYARHLANTRYCACHDQEVTIAFIFAACAALTSLQGKKSHKPSLSLGYYNFPYRYGLTVPMFGLRYVSEILATYELLFGFSVSRRLGMYVSITTKTET